MQLSLSVRIAESPKRKDVAAVPVETVARLAAAAGFDGLSIRASVLDVDSPQERVHEVRTLLDELGLRVSMVTTQSLPAPAAEGDITPTSTAARCPL